MYVVSMYLIKDASCSLKQHIYLNKITKKDK